MKNYIPCSPSETILEAIRKIQWSFPLKRDYLDNYKLCGVMNYSGESVFCALLKDNKLVYIFRSEEELLTSEPFFIVNTDQVWPSHIHLFSVN